MSSLSPKHITIVGLSAFVLGMISLTISLYSYQGTSPFSAAISMIER